MQIVFIVIHVIGTGALLAAVLVPPIVVFKKTLDQRDLHLLSQLKWLGTCSIVVLILSGLSLMDGGAEHSGDRRVFFSKLGLIVVSGIVANLVIERQVKKALTGAQPVNQKFLKTWFILHTLVVLAIVVLGVMMSFGQ